MADTKISQLPAATTPLSGAELVPLVQSGATVQTPTNEISKLTAATANTFTAAQTISTGASQALLSFTANAGVSKTIQFITGANSRWVVSSESTAESGANAGSNFIINNYNDAGAYLSTPFQITRSTGNVGIGVTPTAKLHVLDFFDGNKTICSFNNISNVSTATAASIDLVADQSWVRFTTTRDGVGTSAALTISPTVAGTPTDRLRIDTSGNILNVSSGGLGYGTGSGGTVTQVTNKATAVTLNKTNGQIVTSNGALANNITVVFAVFNSTVAATDTIVLNIKSGGSGSTQSAYFCWVDAVAAGQFNVCIRNISGGTLSEALTLNFAVIKAVTS